MEGPGFLAVAIQPGDETDLEDFHDWYDLEHGPHRLRLPFIETGDRYEAADEGTPRWWATYDVSDLSFLEKPVYWRLRESRSTRETKMMSTFDSLERNIYSVISSHGDHRGPARVTVAESLRLPEADLDKLGRYLDDGYIPAMSRLPGWLRTRRFKTVAGAAHDTLPEGQVEHLTITDFSSRPILSSPALRPASSAPHIHAMITQSGTRLWSHRLALSPLREPPSTFITPDGSHLRYSLSGSVSDPVIVLVNSILTPLELWDPVASRLLSPGLGPSPRRRRRPFRVLRYSPRGYHSPQSPHADATDLDVLADDLEYLLSRLGIERVRAVVGVSMGGVTAMNFAIRHADMLGAFVACDCNVASGEANSAAWRERVDLAAREGMGALAEVTVGRWFVGDGEEGQRERVRGMVAAADFEGFRRDSLALSAYDLRPGLGEIKVPGLLVAGEGDGKIPAAMRGFGIEGARFEGIPRAGHLPFLENLEGFMKVLDEFL